MNKTIEFVYNFFSRLINIFILNKIQSLLRLIKLNLDTIRNRSILTKLLNKWAEK